MSKRREVLVSVDVEASGPVPGEYSLLSIGACVMDDENETFSCELKPINRNAVPAAMKVTGMSLDILARTGLEPEEAMKRFESWASGLARRDGSLVFVGFNAAFDWSFVNYYFHRFLGRNPFGIAPIDIKSYYMGATGCDWAETRSRSIAKSLAPARTPNHEALQDALFQAEIFRLARQRRAEL